MKHQTKCGRVLSVKDDFLVCPRCRRNKKVIRITPDTTAINLAVYCRYCKSEIRIDILEGQCFESQSQ